MLCLLVLNTPFSLNASSSGADGIHDFVGEFLKSTRTEGGFVNSVKCSSDLDTLTKSADQN
jgi:hypothetical protein